MKKSIFIGIAGAAVMLLSACGETDGAENVSEAQVSQEASNDSSAEAASEDTASDESSLEKSDSGNDGASISDEDWKECYRAFLKELDGGGQFSLFDLDNDGVPELFLDADSKGTKEIYAYDGSSNTVKTTDVYCGYHTSGSIMLRQIKDTNYFITGPAFSEDTVLYKFENGEAKQIIGCGMGAEEKPYYYSDSFEKEITKEEFEKTFKDSTGIEWTASLPGLKGDLGLTEYLSKDLSDDAFYTPFSEADKELTAEAVGEIPYYQQYEIYSNYVSAKERWEADVDEQSQKLYDSFLQGKEKAVFSADGDISQYIEFSEFLTDGKAYTIDEIIAGVTSPGQYGERWNFNKYKEYYVDCGLDGKLELDVCLEYDSEFTPEFVVTNINGKLKICFCCDSWSRSETNVFYSGKISSFGSSGATSHGGRTGYIDADGVYHFWYRTHEEYNGQNCGGVIEDFPGLDENLQVIEESIRFENYEGYDKELEKKYNYYYFYIVDKDDNDIEDDPASADNPYDIVRKAYKDAGYNVTTYEEAEKMKTDARKKIGLTDEIYNYGDEYKPEE
ncbi:hypothetical protein D6853_07575 [Butyrivibrio sp. X503]|uniref:hypothetical protein n=1 Tax=Butyrivibrio sp. X503 TaxID=2364878 RepID=UPI000EA8A3B7|nr:hypothetical protein [Butyrivibrio sp. X503]RKM56630.1 hypothetical protein D6853_07575 [Butyrivibrio sp. X503]